MALHYIKKRFCILFLSGLFLSSLSASALAVEFPDVSGEYWARQEIDDASDYGLIQGTDTGLFLPDQRMDKASFVSILQRMFGWTSVTPETPSFSDVTPGSWYYAAAETARAHGVTGDSTLFQPNAYITREDMAVMLVRALGYEALAEDIADNGCPFPDVTEYPGHIALAAAIGMTNGIEVNGQLLFQPGDFATRGQAAAMLLRVYERYVSKVDWLGGFYAFSSYPQIDLSSKMNSVSVGWSRLSLDETGLPWLNSTSAGGNDWVKPQGADSAISYFQNHSIPYNLNVYADTDKDVTLPDGTATSVLDTILPDASLRAAAIAAITAAAPDYAGITIDMEGLKTDTQKANFTAFMTELRAALPTNRTLFVCVPPDDWYKGYDFRALGELCDKVIYMVHDYQWVSVPDYYVGSSMGTEGGKSSPVTPFPRVYQALADITDPQTGVQDKSKIALQISFGSAGFQIDSENHLLSTTIFHPAQATLAQRLLQADTVTIYDEHSRNPVTTYTGDDGARYILWYEDAHSISDKLTLARMFGITGVSIWRLGNIPAYDQVPNYDVWSAVQAQR